MATSRSFSSMLNQYLPNRLLKEEIIKRDWFLSNVDKDEKWKGGTVVVPFKGAGASSVEFGQLAGSSDIAESTYVRGTISSYKEVWGSLLFNHTDLMQHDGRIPEDGFLRVLADNVEDFMVYMKEAVSINLLTGPHFAKATADTDLANGIIAVDRIDRFALGQKLSLDDDNSSAADYYVIAINVNSSDVTLSATRGGSAANISAYTTAQNAKFYHPGAQSAGFQSVRDALLSNANGGGASLHGQTKTAYPYLQAVNIDGSSITAANILDEIFDAYVDVRKKARGNANKVVMSYKHLGSILKLLQTEKGAYHSVGQQKASEYGWTEIMIGNVKGSQLSLIGIQEMDDDVIFFLDMSAMKFRSNGMFKKRKSPEGQEFYEVRATTGYSYIVDVCLFGELEVSKPGNCGVIYSISY